MYSLNISNAYKSVSSNLMDTISVLCTSCTSKEKRWNEQILHRLWEVSLYEVYTTIILSPNNMYLRREYYH